MGFGNMIKIGELADKNLADQIVRELLQKNIHVECVYDDEIRFFVLYARTQEEAAIAFDYYRVKVGLAPPPKPIPEEWKAIKAIPLGPVTLVFIGISLAVFASRFFIGEALYEFFFISNIDDKNLKEFWGGEYWRIYTPVFLHFNFIHILFNGLWMKDLGSLVEHFKGKSFYLILLIFSGLVSNIGQFIVKGPYFGGLSGVVYALLGFVWMNKKFDSESSFALPKHDVIMMIGWFFICFFGVFGPIANTAHGLGLGVGMIFGILSGCQSSGKWPLSQGLLFTLLAVFFGVGTFLFEFFVIPMITKG